MKRGLNRIITEVINNAVLFNDLSSHASELAWQLKNLRNNNQNGVNDIVNFHNDLAVFTEALINAINRCIKNRNLNESGVDLLNQTPALNDLYYSMLRGLNSDLIGDIRRQYRQAKDVANGNNIIGYGNSGSGRGMSMSVPNKNEKLEIILTQYFPLMQQRYVKINKKYDNALENMNPPIAKYILQEVEEVIYTINNAQGQNP